MRAWRVVFAKEIVDALRDRRTLATLLLTSIAMGPLLLALLSVFVAGLEEKRARREIYLAAPADAPTLVNFLERQGIAVRVPPEDYEAAIRGARLEAAVVRVRPGFEAGLARREPVRVEVVHDASRAESSASAGAAFRLLRAFGREVAGARLIAHGAHPGLVEPVKIDEADLSSSQAKGAGYLFIVPLAALLAAVVGAMPTAIDVTAGERERGSLEPLLFNPVGTRALVAGKWLATAAVSLGTVAVSLVAMLASRHLIRSESLAALFNFGPWELVRFLALLAPFAAFIAALLMLVAAYGRTFKEAQTYASYLTTLVPLVPALSPLLSIRDATWQLFVPALGQNMVLNRIARGDATGWVDYALPTLVCAAGTAAALALLARLLQRESIVFGRA